MSHTTEIRDVSPTMLGDTAWRFLDFEDWWRMPLRDVIRVTIGYYKACSCGWADPTCHDTRSEARAAKLPCDNHQASPEGAKRVHHGTV